MTLYYSVPLYFSDFLPCADIAAITGALGEAFKLIGHRCLVTICPVFQIQALLLCFCVIGIYLCVFWIVWYLLLCFKSAMICQQDFLSIIINLINLSSTNNHCLTTFLMTSVVIGTSVQNHAFCKILTPISFFFDSNLPWNV